MAQPTCVLYRSPPDLPHRPQAIAERAREVRHLIQTFRSPHVEPARDLAAAIRGFAQAYRQRLQLRQQPPA